MNYLVIGASSGIGKALVEKLSSEGHEVFGTYNEHLTNEPNIEFHHLNVLDEELDFSYLPDRLDGLVYCPGAIHLKPFRSLKAEQFLNDYHLQLVGAVKAIQSNLKRLQNSNFASLVMFSSVAVQSGFPYHALVSSSKGAVEGLCKALAAEFAPKIRVNAIAPSLTQTPLAEKLLSSEEKIKANAERHPLKKIGQAEDLAKMAAFLLSENASWISGQIFNVDGGMSTLKV